MSFCGDLDQSWGKMATELIGKLAQWLLHRNMLQNSIFKRIDRNEQIGALFNLLLSSAQLEPSLLADNVTRTDAPNG